MKKLLSIVSLFYLYFDISSMESTDALKKSSMTFHRVNVNPMDPGDFLQQPIQHQIQQQASKWGIGHYVKSLLGTTTPSSEKRNSAEDESEPDIKAINHNLSTPQSVESHKKIASNLSTITLGGLSELGQFIDSKRHQQLQQERNNKEIETREKIEATFKAMKPKKSIFVPKNNFKIIQEAGTYLCFQNPQPSAETFILGKINKHNSDGKKLGTIIEDFETAESRPLAGYSIKTVKIEANQYAIYKFQGLKTLTKLPNTDYFNPSDFISIEKEIKETLSANTFDISSLSFDSGSGETESGNEETE
ncbi:hypothetical protein IPH25_02235 [bacterium]|nr:MAG: hypothetical protein IPG37_04375 [bacterium]QQR62242.1 MAG: hypothetical protein IPH25_02235 [bacterium]QQR63194.1 MAG: hypothetical protein IPH67_01835 [bacterium]